VGEFAVKRRKGNILNAISEAAFMIGLERNADIVEMAAYAPLLSNANMPTSHPIGIYADASRCYGTPSYYVQRMFGENYATELLDCKVDAPDCITDYDNRPVKQKAIFANALRDGDEIVVKGTKTVTKDGGGQIVIDNAEILANFYGNHEYSTAKFITNKTLADIKALSVEESHSTEVYVVKAVVEVVETAYYTNLKITYNGVELPLYCSSAAQYNWLKQFAGKVVTMEIALCNWNNKKFYKGCVLAVYTDAGKVINTLNFD
jgi:hypothetical protein